MSGKTERAGNAASSYEDIIHLPHHVSPRHPQMPLSERAAQFAPFAALTGFGAVITESGRLTERRPDIDEDVREENDRQLARLRERLRSGAAADPDGLRFDDADDDRPAHAAVSVPVVVTYFKPDPLKEGGSIETVRGRAVRLLEYQRILQLEGPQDISLDEVLELSIPED